MKITSSKRSCIWWQSWSSFWWWSSSSWCRIWRNLLVHRHGWLSRYSAKRDSINKSLMANNELLIISLAKKFIPHNIIFDLLDWILSSCMATSLEISGEFSCPNGWPKWLSISWVLKVNVDKVGFEDVSGTAFSFLISAFLQTSSLHKRVVWTDRLVDWGPHDFTDISSVCDSGMAISTWLLRMSLLGVEGKDNKAWWSPLEVAEFSPKIQINCG